MLGQMMDGQLLISGIARHADRRYGDQEIVSCTVDNPRHRYTYREAFARSRKLANALAREGLGQGDFIATLAWNDYRHFELYYGITGSGMVCHTINPRLFEDQIVFIINDAADSYLFLDPTFVPLVEAVLPRLDTVPSFVILTDDGHMPETSFDAVSYEAFIADESDEFEWPEFDENTASGLCYTSGTTGNPKGVLYSHRSTVLHSLSVSLPDLYGLSAHEVLMAVVPMFHVNAWNGPYAATLTGAKMVFPGPEVGNPAVLQELIEQEGVTVSAGVPTIWQGLLAYLDASGKRIDSARMFVSGGSSIAFSLVETFRERYGVELVQGWGMTETSPLGTMFHTSPFLERLPEEDQRHARAGQGAPPFGVDLRIVDEDGGVLPQDGETVGALQIRGPWIAARYFSGDGNPVGEDAFTADGWLDTGDVGSITPLGYMHITDRTKDLIKSGGEWISSIELENIALAHPAVRQAAVIAMPDEKWQERPLLVVEPEESTDGTPPDAAALLDFYDGQVAKWWVPDAVAVTDSIPLTATGKISKLELRRQLNSGALTVQTPART